MIRPATPADRAAVEAVVARAFGVYIARIGERPRPMEADHAALIAAGGTWVLDEDGTVAGVLVSEDHPDHLYLDVVAVDPSRQGAGLGRTLIAHAERLARDRGRPEIRLHTNVKMVEAQALYRRLGYAEADDPLPHRLTFVKRLARPRAAPQGHA